MYDTHTPAEWAAAGSLGVSAISVIALALAFAGADAGYFDPRYQLALLVESGHVDWLLNEIAAVRAAVRDTALDTGALFLLLTTSPKGALR
jgi:hypothetical protein